MIEALIVSLALVAANGFFVASEFAFIAARRSRIELRAQQGSQMAEAARRSMRQLPRMFAGSQLGITMASLGLGYVAEPAAGRVVEGVVTSVSFIPNELAHTAGFVVALAIVAFVHMVFGEMVPKNLTIAAPETSAMAVAIPMRAWTMVFRPVTASLSAAARGLLRLLRIDARDELIAAHTTAEIAGMISVSRREGAIPEFEHRLLSRVLSFGDEQASTVMVPRPDVVTIGLDTTAAQAEDVVRRTGHSRLPVTGHSGGDIVGFVHAKDLLRVPGAGRHRPIGEELVRPILVVPSEARLRSVLVQMRRRRTHFALVVGEGGVSAGIVTLEDVLEEVVGDIRDEHDARIVRPRPRPSRRRRRDRRPSS